jgi:hypothetical protein
MTDTRTPKRASRRVTTMAPTTPTRGGKYCGDWGGIMGPDHRPCTKLAGWGRGTKRGRCKYHDAPAMAKIKKGKRKFIKSYGEIVNTMIESAQVAGVSVETVKKWRDEDEEFDREVQEMHDRNDELRYKVVEDSTFKQIVAGTAAPSLHIFWLTNRAPARWKQKGIEVAVDADGQPLVPLSALRQFLPSARAVLSSGDKKDGLEGKGRVVKVGGKK